MKTPAFVQDVWVQANWESFLALAEEPALSLAKLYYNHCRIEVASAAHMMGHSVQVHLKAYHRWFGREHYHRAYEAIVRRQDRPQPPQPNVAEIARI